MKNNFTITPLLIFLFFITLSAQPKEIIINNDLIIIPISQNSYRHISYVDYKGSKVPCNGLVYFNDDECIVVDTPTSDSVSIELINWIQENKKAKIVGVVSTHWHDDCAGGLQAFHNEKILSYSFEFTRDTLITQNLPAPQYVFSDSMKIKVGNKFAELYYPGPGHVKDNIVVWFEDEKILFGGCLVKEFKSQSIGYIGDADLNNWDKTLTKVKVKFPEAKVVIPGHWDTGGLELIDKSIEIVVNYRNKK